MEARIQVRNKAHLHNKRKNFEVPKWRTKEAYVLLKKGFGICAFNFNTQSQLRF